MTMDAVNLTADTLIERTDAESLRPVVSTRRVTITTEDGSQTDEGAGSPLLKSILALLGAGAVLAGATFVNPPAATAPAREAKAAAAAPAPAPVVPEAPKAPEAKPVVAGEPPPAVAPKRSAAPKQSPNTDASAPATKARRAPAITTAVPAEPAAPPPLENPY